MRTDILGRLRRAREDEGGFTLVEALAALMVLALLMMALAYTTISAYRTVRDSRSTQRGTSYGAEAVEQVRALGYDRVSMLDSELVSARDVTTTCTGGPTKARTEEVYFDPDGTGPMGCEIIVSSSSNASTYVEHMTTEGNDPSYTVRRYATWVDSVTQGGSARHMKRITIVVDWNAPGETQVRQYRATTLVAPARAGLAVPNFTLNPPSQTKSANRGIQVAYLHTIKNLGVSDSYDINATVTGRSWSFSYYKDVGVPGVFNPAEETMQLTDTNGTGTRDTGSVLTDQTFDFWVVWTLAPTEALGSVNVTVQATSGLDNDVFRRATDTIQVRNNLPLRLWLHNFPTPPTGHTNAISELPMDQTAPTAATLWRYSTNTYNAHSGRYIEKGLLNPASSDRKFMTNWVFQMPETIAFSGNVTIKMWMALKDMKCDKTPALTAYLRTKGSRTATSGTTFATATVTSPPQGSQEPCGFREVTITIPINRTVNNGNWLELKVMVDQNAAQENTLIAYDTVGFSSYIELPRQST